ncbi:39S ribosomal protein L52, mitochondrial [Coturnix japonica]|uniref:39S ribosomal protein L52, mitochondrial n=1 Tax=Coturnix japonica TaxID=93934 RepID=UPI0007779B0D|nr:39S ribosomal protein L52, mitochondrial [Coturnix japonica]
MAARRALRIAERRALSARPIPSPPQRIGQWRISKGLAAGSSGYGPLRDRPDWSFVDGRPAPLWAGQVRRVKENQELALRAVSLIQSLDAVRPKGRSFPFKPLPQLRLKGPVPKSPFSPPKQ